MFRAKWPYEGLPKAQMRGPVVDTGELTGALARRSSELLARCVVFMCWLCGMEWLAELCSWVCTV
jgi:hypothetical protein